MIVGHDGPGKVLMYQGKGTWKWMDCEVAMKQRQTQERDRTFLLGVGILVVVLLLSAALIVVLQKPAHSFNLRGSGGYVCLPQDREAGECL